MSLSSKPLSPVLSASQLTSSAKDAIAQQVRERRAAGEKWSDISASYDISSRTLRTWMYERGSSDGFLPVRLPKTPTSPVAAKPLDHWPVLVSPGGFRVENLSLTDLVILLRSAS